jgi:hypothetical protein
MNRTAVVLSCLILAGCAPLSLPGSPPIVSWVGKHSVDETVDCVTRALDYNFRSARPLLPSVTHHVDTVEPGRVYDIFPQVGVHHVRVRSEGPEKTIIELFIPATMYNAPLRDLLAKCA